MEKDIGGGIAVVVVPLPAQGHLNQLLHLTRLISTKGIPVHYIGSSTHNRQAKDRVHGFDPSTISNIHFHDIQFPQVITPPPNPQDTNKFPKHMLPAFEASFTHSRQPLRRLIQSLSSSNRRVIVVHDSFMSFAAQDASLFPNTEAYCFHSTSAFAILFLQWEALGKPIPREEGHLIPHDLPRVYFEDCFPEGFSELVEQNMQWGQFDVGNILNTCEPLEGKYINLFTLHRLNTKVWALGPLNPITIRGPNHKCLEWLDRQPQNSVLYVSFGTTTSLSDDQIAEIAMGLERSEQKFIWVLRDADIGDIYKENVKKAKPPKGFEERMKGLGMIVSEWVPQLEILAHPSTGGFMSHCGWNSCMESLSMGVPIAAWPMHSDQPRNSMLLTQVLKVGVLVREWKHRKELISSDIVENSIRRLMELEEGREMRKRASELGAAVRQAVADGGSSTIQFQSFLNHISR